MSVIQPASLSKLALAPKEAAAALGVSVTTLCRDRSTAGLGGIPFARLGGKVVYPVRELESFLASQAQRAQVPQVPVAPAPPAIVPPPVKRGRGRPRKLAQAQSK